MVLSYQNCLEVKEIKNHSCQQSGDKMKECRIRSERKRKLGISKETDQFIICNNSI
ncbi:Hypothetical predicted protein [Mytilus galloprovincialis]|uniref:Uncharacterized protein n=1 Tax=Mytilus galloprovincialis TaxID=29158 RepID=A0A8B6CBM9_MYTGA|nr:Hypothetical predicted protein [Mytilus galloprovincialis]